MNRSFIIGLIVVSLGATGCMSAGKHREAVRDEASDKVSVGTVQREVRKGMSSAEVVSVLGSPNLVTTDNERRETWVYDKVATEQVYSASQGGFGGLLGGLVGGAAGALGGGGSGSFERGSGASSTSQRTMTIIIKFDENGMVRDYSYRQSSF